MDQLKRWYRNFNKRFFNGSLTDDVELFYGNCVRDMHWYAYTSDFDDKEGFEICIDKQFENDETFAKILLLHEMIHIKTWKARKCHGEEFEKEIIRLVKIGAYKGLL